MGRASAQIALLVEVVTFDLPPHVQAELVEALRSPIEGASADPEQTDI